MKCHDLGAGLRCTDLQSGGAEKWERPQKDTGVFREELQVVTGNSWGVSVCRSVLWEGHTHSP